MGLTWLVSLFLSLALTVRMLDTWVQRHFKVRLHRYSAAMCFCHSGEEERSGHPLLLGVLQPHCRGSIRVSLRNGPTHSFLTFHQEHGSRLSTNGTCYCPGVLVLTLAATWNHLGSWTLGSFCLPLLGQHLPRTGTFVCLQLHLQISSLIVPDTPWMKYHLHVRPCHALWRYPRPSQLHSSFTVSSVLFSWVRNRGWELINLQNTTQLVSSRAETCTKSNSQERLISFD